MPNIKSVMKNDIKSKRQNLVNKAAKSALKTDLKKFDAAVAAGDHDAAVSTYKTAVKAVDRAASKGLIHKNKAAHRKSAMAQKSDDMHQYITERRLPKWILKNTRIGSARN